MKIVKRHLITLIILAGVVSYFKLYFAFLTFLASKGVNVMHAIAVVVAVYMYGAIYYFLFVKRSKHNEN